MPRNIANGPARSEPIGDIAEDKVESIEDTLPNLSAGTVVCRNV